MKLFGGRREKPLSIEAKLSSLRLSEPYRRLKDRVAGGEINVEQGLKSDSLTVGDLVDIVQLYRLAADAGSNEGAFKRIASIAGTQLSHAVSETEVEAVEIERLAISSAMPKDLDRNSPIYKRKVSLQQALADGFEHLIHYPGGLTIEKKRGEDDRYQLLLLNHHSVDDGKPIAQIFKEVGLPVRSNINLPL